MKLTTIATAALATTAAAAPWSPKAFWGLNPAKCLSQEMAASLVDAFGSLISAYSDEVADRVLAEDLTDFSDSINSLAGIPVGTVTFATKEAFKAGQGAQPPVPFELLAIESVTCDTISLRWLAGLQPEPVKGITILKTSNTAGNKDSWQIKTIYTEFNSISWLKDIGGNVTFPVRPSA